MCVERLVHGALKEVEDRESPTLERSMERESRHVMPVGAGFPIPENGTAVEEAAILEVVHLTVDRGRHTDP